MTKMAVMGQYLVAAIFVLSFLQANSQSSGLSKESQAIIMTIKGKLENRLSDKCKSLIPMAISLATTDEQISSMCDKVNSFKPLILSQGCSADDYENIEKTICDETKTPHTDANKNTLHPGLSKKASAVLERIFNDLSGVSNTCATFVISSLKKAKSDQVVNGICENLSLDGVKKSFLKRCNEREYILVIESSCNAIKDKPNVSGKSNSNLSQTGEAAKEMILSSLPDQAGKCYIFVNKSFSMVKSDQDIFDTCKNLERPGNQKVVLKYCTKVELNIVQEASCNAAEEANNENTNSDLSNESIAIIKSIKEKLHKILSDKCQPMIEFAASFAKSDEQIKGLCTLVKGSTAKPLISQKCSPDDYNRIVNTICEMLGGNSPQTNETQQVSDTIKHVIEALKNNVTSILDGSCKNVALRKISDPQSDDEVFELCHDIEQDTVKKGFLEFCSDDQFQKLKQLTCDKIHQAEKDQKTLSTRSREHLNSMMDKLGKLVSDKCKPLLIVAKAEADTDAKVKNMCKSVKSKYKKQIVERCSKDDYSKIVKVICGGDCGALSKAASTVLSDVITASKKVVTDKCKSFLQIALDKADTDDKVIHMCDSLKIRYKTLIISVCSKEDYDKVIQVVCVDAKDKFEQLKNASCEEETTNSNTTDTSDNTDTAETTPLPPTHEFKTAPFYFTTPRYTRKTPQPSPSRPFYFTTPRYTRNTPTHTPSTPNATVNASTTPSPIHHDFTCDVTSMSVHFPVSLLPNSKLTLRDTDCVLNKTDTKYVLAFQFDDCGSSITYFHNKIVVENEINVHKDFGWSPFPIEFDADFKIPISCSIKRTVVIGGEIETVTHDSIVEEPDSNKVVRYTLKEFKTEEYKQEITAFPVKIPINREVFLELSSNASSPSLGIQIDECIATPSVNPKDPVAYPLIKNDCPVSPAAHVVTSTSAVKRRFKIQAFHFSGRVNNHNRVYFHCQVTYCLPYSCPMPTCSRSKRETRISRSRRVRRGVVRGQRRREIRTGSYISLGPFKIE